MSSWSWSAACGYKKYWNYLREAKSRKYQFSRFSQMLRKYVQANCITRLKDSKKCMKYKEFARKYWKFTGMCSRNVIKNLGHRNMSTQKLIFLNFNTLEYMIETFLTFSCNNHFQETLHPVLLFCTFSKTYKYRNFFLFTRSAAPCR